MGMYITRFVSLLNMKTKVCFCLMYNAGMEWVCARRYVLADVKNGLRVNLSGKGGVYYVS